MERVIVGIDDSEGARAALRWAARHGDAIGGEVTVLHAYDSPIAWIDVGEPRVPEWRERAADRAREQAEAVVRDALGSSGPSPPVQVEVVVGDPATVLVERSGAADLVVVGTRGRGRFAGTLLGSVSQRVVQHAACPVVVVPE